MTEAEWLAGANPDPMLNCAWGQLKTTRTKVGRRRLRLFQCACLRRQWHLIEEQSLRNAIIDSERYADGAATRDMLIDAQGKVRSWWASHPLLTMETHLGAAVFAATATEMRAARPRSTAANMQIAVAFAEARRLQSGNPLRAAALAMSALRAPEARAQADLVRAVFGNPFRPLPARKFTQEVQSLARACYEGEAGTYAILADALLDLGEQKAASHCRQQGHVKGCHVVDWVLGNG